MSEWKTIDSAPKDGTWILIYYNPLCVPAIAFWMGKSQGWSSPYIGSNKPTHWMHLPEPPNDPQ